MAQQRICSIEGCGKRVTSRGWCGAHYMRWVRHGSPTAGKPSPNTEYGAPIAFLREVAFPFSGEVCLIWPYSVDGWGYGQLWFEGRLQRAHRLACIHRNGPPPAGVRYAAHACGNGHKGCCNPMHMYWATPSENEADKNRHGTARRVDEHDALGAVQCAGRAAVGANGIGADRFEGVLAIARHMPERLDARQVQAVGNKALKAHLAAFSRRRSSRSTASRTKSVLSSPSVKTALMRAKVPSANRACMSSAQSFFLPTRRGIADMRFESQGTLFLILDIVSVSHMSYLITHITYGGKAMVRNKPEYTEKWEIRPCEFNVGWSTVGYILRGPQHGTWVPCHHWGDRRDAEAHVMFLNRGLSREEARERTLALVHKEEGCA